MIKKLRYAKKLIGAPYNTWVGCTINSKAPFWVKDKKVPKVKKIKKKGVNCAGLINLILRANDKSVPKSSYPPLNGTVSAYMEYYGPVMEKYNRNIKYPIGTLLIRGYRDIVDQGHIGVVVKDNYFLQSFTLEGVTDKYTVEESDCGWYYEYAIRPENWLL